MIPKLINSAASALLLAIGIAAGAPAATANGIAIRDVWSRATPPGIEVGVAYLAIENHGKPDRLLAASSPIAKHTELHISAMEDGVMTMRRLDAVDIKADAVTMFAPRGRHIMLVDLKRPLKKGDTFPLTLTFKNAGPVQVTVHVLGIAEVPEPRR
jgi:copper(I)-binding protein